MNDCQSPCFVIVVDRSHWSKNQKKPAPSFHCWEHKKTGCKSPSRRVCCPSWVYTSNVNFWNCFLSSWWFPTSAYLEHTLFEQYYLNELSQAKQMCTNVPKAYEAMTKRHEMRTLKWIVSLQKILDGGSTSLWRIHKWNCAECIYPMRTAILLLA